MAKKRGKAKIKSKKSNEVQKKVLQYFIKKPKHESLASDIIRYFKSRGIQKNIILLALDKLQLSGSINKLSNNKFIFNASKSNAKSEIIGFIDLTKSGNAYVLSPNVKQDVFIKQSNINKAFDGDKVRVELFLERKKSSKIEGKVVEIIERNNTEFVGTLSTLNDYAFVVPDRSKVNVDFFIPKEKLSDAVNGDKVVVKLLEWRGKQKSPIAKIIEVLGKPGLDDVEMKSILIDNGFPLVFNEEVISETNQISETISEEEISNRRDLRKVLTLTIDPKDAKDFDDALSIKKLENGNYEVGIHIADVAYYVKPNTALDKEAQKRATSVYLADRVLPMLPEKISNQICSLRPKEEKCSFSAIFELDEEANVKNEWFGRTVIYSDHRFTYEDAQEVIETRDGQFAEELKLLNDLAHKLRKKRFANGSISFETTEVRFNFDEDGNPVSIYVKQRKDAHLLVEDYMLLANKKVAEFVHKKEEKLNKNIAFQYRVHDLPDIEKLMTLQLYAKEFGYKIDLSNVDDVAKNLNKLMDEVKGTPLQNLLSFLAVRTMAKAKYTTDNIGHFGLAFQFYSHFTSPIRRYPDVLAHRYLQQILDGKTDFKKNEIEAQLEHSSKMERAAIKAERTATKYMQVKFLSNKVGETFEGMISGVKHYGIFVEITENKCEGLIPIETLPFDKYVYDENKQQIKGLISETVYKLGNIIHIKITKTDLEKRTIDFELAQSADNLAEQ